MRSNLLQINDDNKVTKYNIHNTTSEWVELLAVNMNNGIGRYQCPECNGTGVFWITDEVSQKCIYCKTSGWVNISIF